MGHEKIHVVAGVFFYDFGGTRAIRQAAGVTEIQDIFTRQYFFDLAHGGKAAETAVKNADGKLVYMHGNTS